MISTTSFAQWQSEKDRRMVKDARLKEEGVEKKKKKKETRSYEFKIVASWREEIWKWDRWDFGGGNICDLVWLEVRYMGGHASSVRTNGWCLPMRIRIILPAGLSILSDGTRFSGNRIRCMGSFLLATQFLIMENLRNLRIIKNRKKWINNNDK